jgi:hypothetical protein
MSRCTLHARRSALHVAKSVTRQGRSAQRTRQNLFKTCPGLRSPRYFNELGQSTD